MKLKESDSKRVSGKVIVIFFLIKNLLIFSNSFSQCPGESKKTDCNIVNLLAMYNINKASDKTGIISKPGTITGITTVSCNATGIVYSIALVPGATDYSWSFPADASIATGQGTNSITLNFGTVSGNVCVSAENACGMSNASCIAITIPVCVFVCGGAMMDSRDNKTYTTVQEGTQCWMSENLNYGTWMSVVNTPQQSGVKFCQNLSADGNDDSSCPVGGLYEWATAMNIPEVYGSVNATPTQITEAQETCSPCGSGGVRGICPNGWHIPTNAEWIALTDYLSANSEYWCGGNSSKIAVSMANTWGWYPYSVTCTVGKNQSSNNASGFNGVPSGYSTGGVFFSASKIIYCWTATEDASSIAWYNGLWWEMSTVSNNHLSKLLGLSIRCLKD